MTDKIQKPTVTLSEITFSDGKTYKLKPNDKIMLVGPNNAGKSLALREIYRIFSSRLEILTSIKDSLLCVKEISYYKVGNSKNLKVYLKESHNYNEGVYSFSSINSGFSVNESILNQFDGYNFSSITGLFLLLLNTQNRLELSKPANSITDTQAKTHAAHYLFDDDNLLKEVSSIFKNVFKQGIAINYRGGSEIPIHIGDQPKHELNERDTSKTYVKKFRKLPLLHLQGDGIRSFAGIIFQSLVIKHDITLIDEPEAFLHPPQAKKLGAILSKELDNQIIAATHSSDILKGFLENAQDNIKIIRLQRDGDINQSHLCDSDILKDLWTNPVLKYSNALDAIFHEQAILCEGDADCRFYQAITDHMVLKDNLEIPDTHFIPCGGKSGFIKVAKALANLGVKVKIIADMDILSKEDEIKSTYEAVGGQWDDIAAEWRYIYHDVEQKRKNKKSEQEKRNAVLRYVQNLDDSNKISNSEIERILKLDNPWKTIKNIGEDNFRGDVSMKYKSLKSKLSNLGIFLVPVGELEQFYKDYAGKKGGDFVNSVLENASLSEPDLEKARNFVTDVFSP